MQFWAVRESFFYIISYLIVQGKNMKLYKQLNFNLFSFLYRAAHSIWQESATSNSIHIPTTTGVGETIQSQQVLI